MNSEGWLGSALIGMLKCCQDECGDDPVPIFRIAGGRILSTVKMHLIKGRSNGDPFCQAVEEVVQDLDLKIKNIVDSQQETLTASTPGVSPARVMGLLLFFLLFSFIRKQISFAWFFSF